MIPPCWSLLLLYYLVLQHSSTAAVLFDLRYYNTVLYIYLVLNVDVTSTYLLFTACTMCFRSCWSAGLVCMCLPGCYQLPASCCCS